MISRIKRWIYSKLFLFDDEVSRVVKSTSTVQENCRDAETRKRVAKAFQEQAQAMQSRAMKAHDPSCEDPISCKKTFCYQWAPDKIVKVETINYVHEREEYLKSRRVNCSVCQKEQTCDSCVDIKNKKIERSLKFRSSSENLPQSGINDTKRRGRPKKNG